RPAARRSPAAPERVFWPGLFLSRRRTVSCCSRSAMKLPHSRILLALCALAFAGSSAAQNEGARGNTPPGMSQDGSRPADGAIVGGSIKPGERAGTPEKVPSTSGVDRCNELSGTLREQCLEQEKRSASGGTGMPDATSKPPAPASETPPPQNPR